ncbi:hypothetical protein [Mycobacterium deserti]|uniref:Alanine and proline rich membrane protein n=1 Tax=Mycobacterium deserti TaxID=2978347 RepID=A0ABT2MD39_9MYCO|nr:hypothetical protein [Mycobacterium deserti]MCT7659876.1 hypothetical protein [Mycobacterium deserti]
MNDDEPRRVNILTIVALVIAIAALGLAGWTFYKTEMAKTEYDATQIADAKAKVCGAMDVVRRGVSLNTNMAPAGGPQDITGAQAVAANARLSLYDGGQYLLARLDPATPAQLSDRVRAFANGLMDIGAHATAGETNDEPAQAARLKEADEANNTIGELCK